MARRVLSGIGVSQGVGVGKNLLVEVETGMIERKIGLTARKVPQSEELGRFKSALERVGRELQQIKVKMERDAGKDTAGIFEAEILMLDDPFFINDVCRRITTNGLTAEDAVSQSIDSLRTKFSALTTKYMRERGEDITDMGLRVIETLRGERSAGAQLNDKVVAAKDNRVVVVSKSLTSSTVAQFDRRLLAGIVTETGSRTSHLAIVARSLGIPAVFNVRDATGELREGDFTIVDGNEGQIIANPSADEVGKYEFEAMPSVATPYSLRRAEFTWEPTRTVDGHRVQVFANVSDLEGVREAAIKKAEGIGLFRTEFLYFNRETPPSENEFLDVMRQTTSIMSGRPIVVRTLDIGGDKKPSYIEFPSERNPALGLRGIRYCLADPSLLMTQVSGVLRANEGGDLRIMLPMVTTLKDLTDAKQLIEDTKRELKKRGVTFNTNLKIGIMVETPSAALISDKLAAEADFFSIGTNDLAQYTLAADRENENIATIADPLEPSVLKLIYKTITSAHTSGRHVGMCGEMAADTDAIPILLGMGLDEFSVDPSSIVDVRETLRFLRYTRNRLSIPEVLRLESATEIREYSRRTLQRKQ